MAGKARKHFKEYEESINRRLHGLSLKTQQRARDEDTKREALSDFVAATFNNFADKLG